MPTLWQPFLPSLPTASKSANIEMTEPQARLLDVELWRRFHQLGTEMVVTRAGRRMFPAFKVALTQLDPAASYAVLLEAVSTPPVEARYRFVDGVWTTVSAATSTTRPRRACRRPMSLRLHPDSPADGRHWMARPASFHWLKLTNSEEQAGRHGHLHLHSMRRYCLRLHLIRLDRSGAPDMLGWRSFTFNETAFIAVTAYQNEEITQLKIDNNPFARGFRNDSSASTGRTRPRQELKNSRRSRGSASKATKFTIEQLLSAD